MRVYSLIISILRFIRCYAKELNILKKTKQKRKSWNNGSCMRSLILFAGRCG